MTITNALNVKLIISWHFQGIVSKLQVHFARLIIVLDSILDQILKILFVRVVQATIHWMLSLNVHSLILIRIWHELIRYKSTRRRIYKLTETNLEGDKR